MNYLLDTNIVIYYLQQQFPTSSMLFVDHLLSVSTPGLSVITEIELLCWRTATPKDIKLLQSFINDSIVYELDKAIKLKTIELRKSFKIKLPDSIIAATALVNNLTLITRNVLDFKDIQNLKMQNPWDCA